MRGTLLPLIFLVGSICLTLASYFLVRRFSSGATEPHTKELAGSVISRISALHGLILALVFAQEMVEFQQLKYEGAVEVNAIADIYFDAARYGSQDKSNIQDPLFQYVRIVINEEWKGLGETGLLSPVAWGKWDETYSRILDLSPSTERQKSLREHMLQRIHLISETRVKRENHAARSVSILFWIAAVSGVILTALTYYFYPPNRPNMLLIVMYGAFTGLILLFIYAFANPYSDPGAMNPDAHHRLLRQLEADRLRS